MRGFLPCLDAAEEPASKGEKKNTRKEEVVLLLIVPFFFFSSFFLFLGTFGKTKNFKKVKKTRYSSSFDGELIHSCSCSSKTTRQQQWRLKRSPAIRMPYDSIDRLSAVRDSLL